MYVSLDKQKMRVVHKHQSVTVVCGLVHIELPDAPADICPEDMVVKHKTDLEIKLLFRSCFPGEADHIPVSDMKSRILQFVEAMPETDVDPGEVKRQADSIRDNDKKPYQYVKGAFRPARPAELFAEGSEQHSAPAAASATVPANPVARPVRPAAAPRPANSAPRASGVREKIWAVADSMWEEAGKPTDRSKVLTLRKQIMDALEQQDVKRTSSSNELGNWQKTRIS